MNDTQTDLDAITARSNAATPGPWVERSVGYVFATATSERAAESGYIGTPVVDTFMWPEHGPANQVFIAHAREDVPALVAEVRRLRAERDGERQRADQANPGMTVDEFREAVGVERASHAARGYDTVHDRAHGVPHLLPWAIDYASRGEVVKSGALIVAALHLSEELEREERGVRAERDALAHVIEQAPHEPDCLTSWNAPEYDVKPCTCWKSTAPSDALAAHDAEVWEEGHEQGYNTGFYPREDEDPEKAEALSLKENPYRTVTIRETTS